MTNSDIPAGSMRVLGRVGGRRISKRLWLPAGILLAAGLLASLAGCGSKSSDGVATAGGGSSASASSGSTSTGDPFKFAQCMRDNGIKNWPDPQPDSGGSKDGGPARVIAPEGADPQQIRQAMEKCKQYLPNGGDAPQDSAADLEERRKFAQCMRDNGLTSFPDPSGESGNQPVPRDIDPNSAEFKAAMDKCRQYLRNPGSAGSN